MVANIKCLVRVEQVVERPCRAELEQPDADAWVRDYAPNEPVQPVGYLYLDNTSAGCVGALGEAGSTAAISAPPKKSAKFTCTQNASH